MSAVEASDQYHGLIDDLVQLGFEQDKVTILAVQFDGHMEKIISWLEMEDRANSIRRQSVWFFLFPLSWFEFFVRGLCSFTLNMMMKLKK